MITQSWKTSSYSDTYACVKTRLSEEGQVVQICDTKLGEENFSPILEASYKAWNPFLKLVVSS
jgi:hypothetical protein